MNEERGFTLALAGGGARGLAHMGVLEVLLENRLRPERIVGVSIGSIIGAIYAFDPDPESARSLIMDYLRSEGFQKHQRILYGTKRQNGEEPEPGFLWFNNISRYLRANRLLKRVLTQSSMLSGRILEHAVENLLLDVDIADSVIPLTVVSLDLVSGRRVVLEKGPLREAVRGSASLPGIFPPVRLDDKLLVDIGVIAPLPTEVCRYYQTPRVVAADVSPSIRPREKGCETALDVMMRVEEIAGTIHHTHVLDLADVNIRPMVGEIEWSDFSEVEGVIDAGRRATLEVLDAIRDLQVSEIR